jgi:NAD(P)-dependent dehydrogenase (short-subunit alcohol dehydrogenase family)
MSRNEGLMAQADFAGKVALVTGGAGGMGRAIALAFADAGARVVVSDLSVDGGEETVALVDKAGGEAHFVATDVADQTSVQQLVATAVDVFGGVDCAVNGAAIELEREPLAEVDEDVFDRIIAVNLRSIFLCMKYEIRQLLAQGRGGTIVNIASTNSFRPQPHQSAYTASKYGVLGMTRNAAIDYAAEGIRINAICPGAIDTPMLRAAIERRGRDPQEVADRLSLLRRFGDPTEIARAALWLSSDESSFTIGHALAVDGGYLVR